MSFMESKNLGKEATLGWFGFLLEDLPNWTRSIGLIMYCQWSWHVTVDCQNGKDEGRMVWIIEWDRVSKWGNFNKFEISEFILFPLTPFDDIADWIAFKTFKNKGRSLFDWCESQEIIAVFKGEVDTSECAMAFRFDCKRFDVLWVDYMGNVFPNHPWVHPSWVVINLKCRRWLGFRAGLEWYRFQTFIKNFQCGAWRRKWEWDW